MSRTSVHLTVTKPGQRVLLISSCSSLFLYLGFVFLFSFACFFPWISGKIFWSYSGLLTLRSAILLFIELVFVSRFVGVKYNSIV